MTFIGGNIFMIRDKCKRMNLKMCMVYTFLVLLIITTACFSYSDSVNTDIANNIVRLHVIANSNLEEDQTFKLRVRDLILDYMKNKITPGTNIADAKKVISDNLCEIREVIKKYLNEQHKSCEVEVMLDKYLFPTKVYGDIFLPAGRYNALKVVLGKGNGMNWWCILFPPLCFIDITHGSLPEHAKNGLRKSLSEDEYKIITSSRDEVPIRIKFKIVEVFQKSKYRLQKLLFHEPLIGKN